MAFQFFHEGKRYIGTVMNLETDVFKIYLTNGAPVLATHTVKADLAGIAVQNGYNEVTLTHSWVETGSGTGIWSFRNNADVSWTATGGNFGPFRYALLYDDTPTSPADPLLGLWDIGVATTITDGNVLTLDLDAQFAIFDL